MLPSSSSMSSSSSLPSRFCFNRECSEFNLQHFRPGWRLPTGDFADLCDRCASAYEQGKFCDIFHLRALGWRCCESCGKRIHCGCIVSASGFMLLDAGGIECLSCSRKKVAMGPNFPPTSFLFQSPIPERIKDLSINWNSSTGSNQKSSRPPSLLSPSILRFDLHNSGDSYECSQPTSKNRAREKQRGMNDLMGILMSENSENHTSNILNNQKAGPNCKVPVSPNVNVYHPMISFKEGPALPVPITTPIDINGHSRLDGSNLWHIPKSSTLSHLENDLNGGADSPFKSKSLSLKTHLDTPGKYQVVPRYWPKVSYKNQVLQNISKESESIVTPLFEKMLSASDTGRIGRLVLPKKCAEAFLPRISHPDGVPLKVQDSIGKEWTFQFRFWPNNKSRMYVLEGITPCIQSMRLQAGDTVIFSRLDPEGKLIMGFRRASAAQLSDQETDSNNNRDSCTNEDDEPVDTDAPSKVKKTTCIAKETPGVEFFSEKKKSSMMITRSKRQKVEKGELIELNLTLEEAQGFILPPPNLTPSIIMIEGFEFEEYEDAPIIGKPTTGSTCSADKTVLAEQHDAEAIEETEGLLMSPETTKHPRHRSGCTCIVCIQSPSGKGPKHEQCCSCMVCDSKKRRKISLLLRREKKQTEKEDNVHKELNSDEELNQSGNNSGNTSKNHASPLKGQIDLNYQPEKDEESLPVSTTTTTSKSLHHDDTVKSGGFEPPSSSSAHSQIDKDDEGKLVEVSDTTKSFM